ncbi:MAG: hypothetical protein ACI9CA_000445 [Natronomonas sp.]|jgi:hypothetical protein
MVSRRRWELSKQSADGIAYAQDRAVCDDGAGNGCGETFNHRNGNRTGLCPRCARHLRQSHR